MDSSARTGVTIPGEASFNVINGPFCGVTGMVWWQLEYNGITGWTPEGTGDTYWVEPLVDDAPPVVDSAPIPQAIQCPGSPVSRLIVGGRARVLPDEPNNLRAEANSSSERIGQIPGEAEFAVLEGPVCADGLAYWRVEYNGQVGWTAEGSGDTYWAEPIQ
jgi:hypothetical protein